MLLQFSFSNVRSFDGETSLDLRAGRVRELEHHIRRIENEAILPIAAVYGANAGGKTNFVEAFRDMADYVRHSYYRIGKTDNRLLLHDQEPVQIPYHPFVLGVQTDEPSTYEIDFIEPGESTQKYIKYGFCVDNEGVVSEWLYTNTKTGVLRNKPYREIFYRARGERIVLHASIEKYRKNIDLSLNDKGLLVSLGYMLRIPHMRTVSQWFWDVLVVDANEQLAAVEMVSGPYVDQLLSDGNERTKVVSYLNAFDPSIVDLEFKQDRTAPGRSSSETVYDVYACHLKDDTNEIVRIPIGSEASGTRKMLWMYPLISGVLNHGRLLVADELDARLHPLLMRILVGLFTNPETNPNHAQLIFTTHNPVYLDMNMLRRDEIWFAEKVGNASDLFSLDDLADENGNRVRPDSNYAKNYLLGRYGGIPELRPLMVRERDANGEKSDG